MVSVYEVTGPTGSYFGKTCFPTRRFTNHFWDKGHLGRAIRKYGRAAFSYRDFPVFETEDQAFAVEKALIIAARLAGQRLYNLTEEQAGSKAGPTVPRLSKDEVQRRATLAAQRANTGRKHPKDRVAKVAACNRAYWAGLDPATRENRFNQLRARARAAALVRWGKKRGENV